MFGFAGGFVSTRGISVVTSSGRPNVFAVLSVMGRRKSQQHEQLQQLQVSMHATTDISIMLATLTGITKMIENISKFIAENVNSPKMAFKSSWPYNDISVIEAVTETQNV